MSIREHLDSLVRGLAEKPSEIRITEIAGAKTQVFEVRCAKADLGKLVGKSGKTVSALRILLNALALKSGRRVALEVVDTAG